MVKPVSFKDEKEKDLIDYLINKGYLDNFSYYVKSLIRKDMESSGELSSNNNEITPRIKKRNTNFEV